MKLKERLEMESFMPGETMIRKGIPLKKWRKRKQAFHGILMGTHSSECLDSELAVQVSELDHMFNLAHLLSDTDQYHDFQGSLMTRGHLECCCKRLVKKDGSISQSSAAQKVLRRVKKHRAAMAVAVETNLENSSWKQLSLSRCVAGQLPEMIMLQSVHDGKIVLTRSLLSQIGGFKLNSGPNFDLDENHTSSREGGDPAFSEIKSCEIHSSEEFSRNDSASLKDGNGCKEKVPLKSISVIRRELPESTLGWPLLPRTKEALRRSKARSMSLIEWVMNLPTRSFEMIMENQNDSHSVEANIYLDGKTEDSKVNNEGTSVQVVSSSENRSVDGSSIREDEQSGLTQEIPSSSFSEFTGESTQFTLGWPLLRIKTSTTIDSLAESEMSIPNQSTQATPKSQINLPFKEVEGLARQRVLPMKQELVLRLNSSGCKQFSYEELERVTHKFSSENLIGEGGCSNVYKGSLRRGKLVAVKILKQYKEAWNDFSLEVDIMSSLKHKHIIHLIGVCIEDDHLILVYDFLSKGSLEKRLKGYNEKSILPWKVRFKVAIAVAEALNYLHNGCSRSIIHRDVKSSNILLSDDFQPQLSDFGLATWGPEDTAYMTSSDIVGTFGYIAPEYFMHGRVSDKIDIYSFGIVLLELLTGKKPISSEGIKGQESLVMWAMPLLESGKVEALVDPMLDGEFDTVQMHRMVLAATLCIKQSPRLRPKASQILNLLREEKEVREWMNDYVNDLQKSSHEELDDFFPEFNHKPRWLEGSQFNGA
ncbi:protein kinase STUNTED isoform X2 [Hevea brasiliensis]|uniref:protein kinase STUNTED isoform X2 n=1 Tax=Hevea brasiliensis TaxID=3981 RepID=UPI0025E298A5|nr:protein kinase STUNTED isoform X2 [Hevea brasiliensis]